MFKKIKIFFYENLYSGEIEMCLTTMPNTVLQYAWGYELSNGVPADMVPMWNRRTYKDPMYKIIGENKIIRNGIDVTKNVRGEFIIAQSALLRDSINWKNK